MGGGGVRGHSETLLPFSGFLHLVLQEPWISPWSVGDKRCKVDEEQNSPLGKDPAPLKGKYPQRERRQTLLFVTGSKF